MLRVALVIDDFNELIYLQTVLRKIGIDVEGLQNVKKYSELSLGFNPQVLIASAYGKKVNGLEFAKTLHRVRGLPKIILLHTPERSVNTQEAKDINIDLLLDSPVSAPSLIAALAAVANVDEAALTEKLKRLQASGGLNVPEEFQMMGEDEPVARETPRFALKKEDPNIFVGGAGPKADESITVSGVKIPSAILEEAEAEIEKRRERFRAFVEKSEPLKESFFDRERILQFNKKIRSAPLPADIQDIEGDRKEFVRNLFKKKDEGAP
jgi:DNA-binding NarL/FixJ family response regulator